jgi:prepilin-type N-terminal cleavage/methylation domain-containing protein
MTTMPAPRFPEMSRRHGYTLAEVLISISLSAILAAAVLSSFLLVGRSGINLASYSGMNGEARVALDVFARDVRQAEGIVWNSTTSITVQVREQPVTYALRHDAVLQEWVFQRGDQSLIRGVDPASFRLTGYRVAFEAPLEEGEGPEAAPRPTAIDFSDLAQAGRETKQLQLELQAARNTRWSARVSNSVVSARYVLRNKRVTS